MNQQQLREKLFGKKKEVIIADRSAVQQYADCPFCAWYKREHGIDEPNILKDVGNEVHALTERLIKDAIENRIPPEELAENIVDALPSTRPDLQPRIIRAARYLADDICKLQVHNVLGVEMQIDDACKTAKNIEGTPFKLTACLDILLKGRNSLIVKDWKSGFKKRTSEETYDDFQAQFDANILFKTYDGTDGDRMDTIHWFFVETFWGTQSYAKFERDAEYPSLPHLSVEAQIEGRIFEALKLWQEDCRQAWPESKKCSWCDIVDSCPHAVTGAKHIAASPKKFVDRMVALEQQLKRYQTIAKDWMKRYGPIQGTNMVWDWRQSTRFTPRLYKNGETEG